MSLPELSSSYTFRSQEDAALASPLKFPSSSSTSRTILPLGMTASLVGQGSAIQRGHAKNRVGSMLDAFFVEAVAINFFNYSVEERGSTYLQGDRSTDGNNAAHQVLLPYTVDDHVERMAHELVETGMSPKKKALLKAKGLGTPERKPLQCLHPLMLEPILISLCLHIRSNLYLQEHTLEIVEMTP